MSPPQLTGNTPILDVFHPVEINLFKSFGVELNFALLYNVNCRTCKRLHLDEPLLGYNGFYCCVTTVARSDIVLVRFDLFHHAHFLELFNNCLTCFVTVHSTEFAGIFVHCTVVVHYTDYRQVVTQTHFKVVGVVSRCNLYNACTKIHVNVFVRNDRDFTVDEGNYHGLTYKVTVTLVVGIYCYCRVAQHCFGTCCSKCNLFLAVGSKVAVMPEKSVLFGILYFGVGQRCVTHRTTVDDSVALVNQTVLVHGNKCLAHSLAALFVHGERKT